MVSRCQAASQLAPRTFRGNRTLRQRVGYWAAPPAPSGLRTRALHAAGGIFTLCSFLPHARIADRQRPIARARSCILYLTCLREHSTPQTLHHYARLSSICFAMLTSRAR